MEKNSLSRSDRNSLKCYVSAQNRPISFVEIFRFYVPNLIWYAFYTLFALIVVFWITPPATSISLNHAVGFCLLAMLGLKIWQAIRGAHLSIGHWRLLQRILDWDRVHMILNDADSEST